jgi:hypothetical protein
VEISSATDTNPPISQYALKHSPRWRTATSNGAFLFAVLFGGFCLIAIVADLLQVAGNPEQRDPNAWLWWAIMGLLPVFILWLHATQREPISRWRQWDAAAFRAAQPLRSRLYHILSDGPKTVPGEPAGAVATGPLIAGELVRHFDAVTTGAIDGWIDHRLGFTGWALGGTAEHAALGIGRLGLEGRSDVRLSLRTTTRTDLLGEGFIVVLEDPSTPTHVTRVVVPSKRAVDAFVLAFVESRTRVFPAGSHQAMALSGFVEAVSPLDVHGSHISDKIGASLRMDRMVRPTVAVVGLRIDDHTIMGGSFLFGDEGAWIEAVPLARLQQFELACINARLELGAPPNGSQAAA